MKELGDSQNATQKTQKTRNKTLKIRQHKFAEQKPSTMSSDEIKPLSLSAESSKESSGVIEGAAARLVCGHVSVMGWQKEMEDAVTVAPPELEEEWYSFFAVYDGCNDAKVAETCREKMHKFVAMNVKKVKDEGEALNWKNVMSESFRDMEAGIELECKENERAEMGSTTIVVLVGKEEVVVANCGDSRAVLCRSGGVVVPLSSDHKIEKMKRKGLKLLGVVVINWNGWRVYGVLSTSRSLGDGNLKPYVCSEPEVSVVTRSRSDKLLIIGTDGLFNVVSNEDACCYVKRCMRGQLRRREEKGSRVSVAANMLAELATFKGNKDNINVIIVQLK